MKIYLIGLPGSGKSTVGRRLAKELKLKYVDTDSLIEQKAMMFIDEIFNSYGEEYFRGLEKSILKELNESDNLVISTGGGIIKDKANKELMNGVCIYLSVDLDKLDIRLKHSPTVRPLLNDYTIYELYEARKDLYDYFSDIKIENDDLNNTIKRIKELLK